jgi:putative tricarboxylic transport membrane protein
MRLTKKLTGGIAVGAALLAATTACAESGADGGAGATGEDYPSEAIEFVTAGDPGGGLDLFARQIQQTLESADLIDVRMDITNLGGGGGNAAMAIGRQREGTANTLIGNSNRVYLNEIMGTTDLSLGEDFVPISQLMTEYVVLAVRDDSPYQSAQDVVDALKQDPKSISLGVGTVPSDDQLHLLRLGDIIGIDPGAMNVVAFSAGGDLMTQLLGGQVDAVSTGLSEALPQYEAGDVRLLAISAPERVEGAASDVPTWTEMGIDLVVDHWRGVFGPAGMPEEAVSYWEDTFAEMVETEEWAQVLETNQWGALYRDSEEFAQVLEEEAGTAEELLGQVGLVQQ